MRFLSATLALMFCAVGPAWATEEATVTPETKQTEKNTQDTAPGQETSATSDNGATATDETELETVEFDGNTLELAFQDKTESGDTIKEFIPKGETLEHWTKLAAIREEHGNIEPKAAVEVVAQRLNEHNPPLPNDVRTDDENGTATIDFIIWPGDAATPDDADYVEYNIFKYSKGEDGGIVSEQYAIRAYKGEITGFLSKLNPLKDRLLDEMANSGLTSDDDDDDDSDESSND